MVQICFFLAYILAESENDAANKWKLTIFRIIYFIYVQIELLTLMTFFKFSSIMDI